MMYNRFCLQKKDDFHRTLNDPGFVTGHRFSIFYQLSVNKRHDILPILYIFVPDQNRPSICNLNEKQKPCIH